MIEFNGASNRNAATLERLALELGVPIEAFVGEPPDTKADDLLTLMRLWSEIDDNQGRQRVLSAARHEAERGPSHECA